MIRRPPTTGSKVTPDPDAPIPATRLPKRIYLLSALGLVALAAVAAVGFALAPAPASTGGPGAGETPGRPTATSTPVPPVTSDAPVETIAEDVVTGFVTALAVVTADPSSGLTAVSAVADGSILKEIEAEQLELTESEFTKVGTPVVVSVEVVDDSNPERVVVAACIDSSDVRVVDAAGEPVYADDAREARALNLYTLELRDGSWIVVEHGFPNDPKC